MAMILSALFLSGLLFFVTCFLPTKAIVEVIVEDIPGCSSASYDDADRKESHDLSVQYTRLLRVKEKRLGMVRDKREAKIRLTHCCLPCTCIT